MGISAHMQDVSAGFRIVRTFAKFRDLPIVLTESDPEGCAACISPQNAYRNGTLYPSYLAVALKTILELANRDHVNLKGILTWAFEFENQPYFYAYRSLATNGVDKPVLNIFRMAGLMRGELVNTQSDGAVPLDSVMTPGITGRPEVDALALRSDGQVSVMVWNYRDDDVSGLAVPVTLSVTGIAKQAMRVLLSHYRIDQTHSNAYAVWKRMGSPQTPDPEQFRTLEEAGQLQLLDSPKWIDIHAGRAAVKFSLPLQGVSLVQLSW